MQDLLIVFLLVIVGSLPLIRFIASIQVHNYSKDKADYRSLSKCFKKLKKRIVDESIGWPIYPRPVLFTEIDHAIQIDFAKACDAIDSVDNLESEINGIALPSSPPGWVSQILALRTNINIIRQSFRFRTLLDSLAYKVIEIKGFIVALDKEQGKVDNRKQEVLNQIEGLKQRLDLVHEKSSEFEGWARGALDKIFWIFDIGHSYYEAAQTRVQNISGDNLEYAVAFVYCKLARYCLDFYELYLNGLGENTRFELDLFTDRLNSLQVFVKSVSKSSDLSDLNINDWGNWRKLSRVEKNIDSMPFKLGAARKRLDDFRRQREEFCNLEKRLEQLNFESYIETAKRVQDECAAYWYPFHENPEIWHQVIKDHELPEKAFRQLRGELVAKIMPSIQPGIVIKQSTLSVLIERLLSLFQGLERVWKDLDELEQELGRHKRCQAVVMALLAEQGEATQEYARLEVIIQDTAHDILGEASVLIQQYRSYCVLAEKVQGANFPKMVNQVQEFISISKALVNRHYERLGALQNVCRSVANQVRTTLDEISTLLKATPAIDSEIWNQFNLLVSEGNKALADYASVQGYTGLSIVQNQLQSWLDEAMRYVEPVRKKRDAFDAASQEAELAIRTALQNIELEEKNQSSLWAWAKKSYRSEIDQSRDKIIRLTRDWKRHKTRGWVEFYLHDAIIYCEDVIKQCEEIFESLKLARKQILEKQQKHTNKVDALNKMAERNFNKISPEDIQSALSLCRLASDIDNYDLVTKYIQQAEKMITGRISQEDRVEINQTINTHINTAGGAYIVGNVNTGSGNFVGRDYVTSYRKRMRRNW